MLLCPLHRCGSWGSEELSQGSGAPDWQKQNLNSEGWPSYSTQLTLLSKYFSTMSKWWSFGIKNGDNGVGTSPTVYLFGRVQLVLNVRTCISSPELFCSLQSLVPPLYTLPPFYKTGLSTFIPTNRYEVLLCLHCVKQWELAVSRVGMVLCFRK